MQKTANWYRAAYAGNRTITKIVLVMKLTMLLLTASFLSVTAKSISQTVKFSGTNVPLDKVFSEVERQTGYVFLFDETILKKARPITIKSDHQKLEDFLDNILRNQFLNYKIHDKTVIIKHTIHVLENNGLAELLLPIKGVVKDEDGNLLAGATVREKGKTISTVTDNNGAFELNADAGSILIFSYVGFQSKEIKITDKLYVSISLDKAIIDMDTTVVAISTGYQNIPRERATGSFVHIDQNLLNRKVSTNILDRLDGITSGLMFNRTNVSDEQISIRGRSTLLAGTAASPLVVLDNFPYEGDVNNINPNDVESITILKDAAAASIWGARAGNGVIVITTKKGSKNQPLKLELNANISVGAKPDMFYSQHFLNASEYIEVERLLFSKRFYDSYLNSTTSRPAVSPVVYLLAKEDARLISSTEVANQLNALARYDVRNDFKDYVYQKSTTSQYALNMRGGSDMVAYTLSMGYDDNQGNMIRNNIERFTLRSMVNFTPIKKLELSAGINYAYSKAANHNQLVPGGNNALYYSNYLLYPYARLAEEDGKHLATVKDYHPDFIDSVSRIGYLDWTYRPLDEIDLADNTSTIGSVILQGRVKYNFLTGLSAQIQYQNERQLKNDRNYRSPQSYYARNLVNQYSQRNTTNGSFLYPLPPGGILALSSQQIVSSNLRGQINFNHLFRQHGVDAIGGAEIREISNTLYGQNLYGYNDEFGTAVSNLDYKTPYPILPTSNTRALPDPGGTIYETLNRYISYYANAAYTFRKKYTLTASGRKDGANIFGAKVNDKITPLWSTGLAWQTSREKFYRVAWLPELKMRLSYGYNGNVYNASTFLTAQYSTSSLTGAQAAYITAPPNPSLRWEKVQNINLGIDFSSKASAISGSVELYRKKGSDLIAVAPLAPSTGFLSYNGNAAATQTNGIDITLNFGNTKGIIKWTAHVLASHLKDKVLSFDTKYKALSLASTYGSLIAVTGKPLFGIYSYPWAGLDPANGDPQGYIDGKTSKDYQSLINLPADSLIFNGSARPTFFGAFRNDFTYKNFSLSLNVTYKLGYVFRKSSTSLNYQEVIASGAHKDYTLRWQKNGDELVTTVPSLSYPANPLRQDFYSNSEVLVLKGDHIRMQDVQLSYTLNKLRFKKLPFAFMQVYIYVNNLGILWRANRESIDPDHNDNFYLNSYIAPLTASVGIKTNF